MPRPFACGSVLLRRATGIPVDEWLVERCGIEAGVTLWRILQIP
jgi:hypothetical protein